MVYVLFILIPKLFCLLGFAPKLGNLTFEGSVFFGMRINRRFIPSIIVNFLVFFYALFHLLIVITYA